MGIINNSTTPFGDHTFFDKPVREFSNSLLVWGGVINVSPKPLLEGMFFNENVMRNIISLTTQNRTPPPAVNYERSHSIG